VNILLVFILSGFSERDDEQKFSPEKPSADFPSLLCVTLPLPQPLPLPLPPSSSQSFEEDRNIKKSFELKELPLDFIQRQSIPVPKIVQVYRHNQQALSNDEIKLSPFMHQINPMLPLATTRSEEESELEPNGVFRPPVLQYHGSAVSLDNLEVGKNTHFPLVAEPYESKNMSEDASKMPVQRKESRSPYFNKLLRCGLSGSGNFEHTSKPPALKHALSLDELLESTGSQPLTLDLDPMKKSKYSRVTITASVEMLNSSQKGPNVAGE